MNWEHFFERAHKVLYTSFLAHIASSLVIILYLLNPKKSKSALYLVLLAAVALLQWCLVEWIANQDVKTAQLHKIAHGSLYVMLIAELSCCLLYIRAHTRSVIAQKILALVIISFIPYTMYYWMSESNIDDFSAPILTVEGLLIIMACVYFFFELFTGRPDRNLFTEPAFWSISGMLVLFTVITPVFLLVNSLIKSRPALFYRFYMANNLAYTVLFITFAITISQSKKQHSFSK